MKTLFLRSEIFAEIGIALALISIPLFVIGLIMIIASQKSRKIGIKLLIGSVIAFVIGFGTCFANLSLSGMH
ncbi:MAG TPA: hypothetical protein VJL37_01930 [Flavobacterium sp.]|nr:hypothetical protein [Flavobacterium sp.]